MAKKNKLDIMTKALEDTYGNESNSAVEKTSNVHPNSIKNLHPREKGSKADTKYMQLNIIEFEDYLNRMARYKGITRTKYILSLIRADYESHKKEYESLKNLSGFDK